ncbi:hypothetical protein HHI36_007805 [Cryptolaemus montrouzieri]|uniref:Uncharacterized protein n=1 Tax=Cryptolaemus montrouzieri TaxID=559131 RepID=A0ABD2MR76_9CUCU
MSTDDLQKNGTNLARKYSKDLNAVNISQELAVFKSLVPEIKEKSSEFDLLQHLYTNNLREAFPNVNIASRNTAHYRPHLQAVSEVSAN